MNTFPTLHLNDGNTMPQFGLGTWQSPSDQVGLAVRTAIEAGYRAIDTATIYKNEAAIGEALSEILLPRRQLHITTKLWNSDQGYDTALKAFDASLARLRLEYIDLYLIHWPLPSHDKYVDTWKALVRLRQEGRVKSIGVSNFTIAHLQRIIDETGLTPAINQIELHPWFPQKSLRDYHARKGIITESWSPIAQGGALLTDPGIVRIAQKHGRTPAQIILRWHIELGLVVIPKSVTPARIRENFALFDFKLDADDLSAIASLETGKRIGPDPDTFDMA
ncbi:MAG: aldo/keto reductase [Puniceicoccales bacterium]|jgi:diketogulonate reductase-like aldo/keto reductase|nr:aldo/keto reductase [Puniceicoccales bacterium]